MAPARGGLVVVGAALGAGRWLTDQLVAAGGWTRVVLVDTVPLDPALLEGAPRSSVLADRLPGDLADVRAAVVAVPATAAPGVVEALVRTLPDDARLVVVANPMAPAAALLSSMPGRAWTAHLLFDPALTAGDGQGVFVAPASPPAWFADAVTASGALLREGDAAAHDAAMTVVQGATHRTLVAFADEVTDSGLDLETLWALRTPVFDSLLSLTTRALDPRQQAQVAALQSEDLQHRAGAVRDRISGTLFEELRTTASAGIQAAQGRRGEIARHLRDGRVVGLRRAGSPASVRVGRIRAVTPTHVALDVLLAGAPGRAAMLDGPGLVNAARLGVPQRIVRHDFGIGHVEVLQEPELQRLLDERLAFLPRDVRFLVPESVAGSGVARVVARAPGLRDVRLVDEVVRTGQRSVVVHLAVRADRDVDEVVEAVRQDVATAYAWPRGVTRAPVRPEVEVAYLGPAGTFSETAARHAAESLGRTGARLTALPGFGDVLAALRPGVVGVLPISSSASGLVSRAVDALLDGHEDVTASGVVDVAVRFDAYVRGPEPLERLRGRSVFSHPQGLAQCTRFVERWGLRPVPTSSTADALERVEHAPEPAVALGGAGLAGALRVAEREVDDLSGSITRFLVVGVDGEFAPQRDGSDPTLRRVWIGRDAADAVAMLPGGAAYSELLTDAAGRFLLVTSGDVVADGPARLLGALPWSPRTPLVRPAAD